MVHRPELYREAIGTNWLQIGSARRQIEKLEEASGALPQQLELSVLGGKVKPDCLEPLGISPTDFPTTRLTITQEKRQVSNPGKKGRGSLAQTFTTHIITLTSNGKKRRVKLLETGTLATDDTGPLSTEKINAINTLLEAINQLQEDRLEKKDKTSQATRVA